MVPVLLPHFFLNIMIFGRAMSATRGPKTGLAPLFFRLSDLFSGRLLFDWSLIFFCRAVARRDDHFEAIRLFRCSSAK